MDLQDRWQWQPSIAGPLAWNQSDDENFACQWIFCIEKQGLAMRFEIHPKFSAFFSSNQSEIFIDSFLPNRFLPLL
jgi:hypothetical protein